MHGPMNVKIIHLTKGISRRNSFISLHIQPLHIKTCQPFIVASGKNPP